jgi:chromate transporter
MGDDARTSLGELAGIFLRLGATVFGGPAAHIAVMEEEFVRRRQWLTREEFLDMLGATNLIPGPNSTEMAIHLGHRRAGVPGLIVAGVCFIAPATLMVMGLAWVYVRFGKVPQVEGVLYGVKPVMVAVVAQALWGFGKSALKSAIKWVIAGMVVAAAVLGVHVLLLLLVAGLVAMAVKVVQLGRPKAIAPLPLLAVATAPVAMAPGVWPVFWFFLKIGSVLYGSGYVLFAFLKSDLVDRYQWLTQGQLLDAIAVGQITPGPLFTAATFVGYLVCGSQGDTVAGFAGALLATVGIFLPAFVFVGISGPLVPKIRKSTAAGAFLDGVVAASLGLMALVSLQLGRSAIVDWPTAVLAVAGLVVLVRFRINSAWLVLMGTVAGWAVKAISW